MKLSTQVALLDLRNQLQQISHISYTVAQLNKQHPIDTLTDETANEMMTAYIDLLRQAQVVLHNFNQKYGSKRMDQTA